MAGAAHWTVRLLFPGRTERFDGAAGTNPVLITQGIERGLSPTAFQAATVKV